jgi:hypothetical protein
LNAVVFFRYLKSAIRFYQMVGRGTRIHEETGKYKFWLYDYTGVTDLFGTDFITRPPRPGGGGGGGDDDGGDDGGGGGLERPPVPEIPGRTLITPQGRFILSRRDGRDMPIPVEEYRREMIQRVLREAHDQSCIPRGVQLLRVQRELSRLFQQVCIIWQAGVPPAAGNHHNPVSVGRSGLVDIHQQRKAGISSKNHV